MSEQSELIEEAKRHQTCTSSDRSAGPCGRCHVCSTGWPCLTVRLAAALEQTLAAREKDHTTWQEVYATDTHKLHGWVSQATEQRDATLARLAAAEREVADNRAMFERQAAAVRHHTARADAAERQRDAALVLLAAPVDRYGPSRGGHSWVLVDAAIWDGLAAALAPTKEEPS